MDRPEELAEAYLIGDSDTVDYSCEKCAVEYAEEHGLAWASATTHNYTEEHDSGLFAYALWRGDTESDYPSACCSCDTYLDTALTPEGENYVRENLPGEWWDLWGVGDDNPTRKDLTYLAHLAGYSLFCNGRCDSPRLEHTYIGYEPEEVLDLFAYTHPNGAPRKER